MHYLFEVCGYQKECGVWWGSLDVAGRQARAWLSFLCLRILP